MHLKGCLDFTAMKRENRQLTAEHAGLEVAMKQYLEVGCSTKTNFTTLSTITLQVMSAGQGGADLARAGIEASRGERAAAQQRRQSRARIDPGGQFGYEMFKM